MAENGRNIDDILARLLSLETSSRRVFEEILPLQREIISLQKENTELKRVIDTLHEDLSKMKKDNEEEKYLNQKNIDRLDKKVSTLENEDIRDMKAAHRKHDENHKTMTKKMKTFRSKTEASEQRIEEKMSQLFQIRTVLNRAMVEYHKDGGVEERVTDLYKRIKSLEDKSDQLSTSLVDVSINTSTLRLTTGKFMKLDKCYQEYINLGGFNTTSGCLQPETTGRYVVFVKFHQIGDGDVSVCIKGDDDFSNYMGKTVRNDDVATGMAVVTIKSIPYNLWVKAIRDEGNAVILWCRLTSWKLCDV